jgi:glycosyltransferase involved in cell wall biosynthesis
VSVIIATNRYTVFLGSAIASVRHQTVPVGELILVDDGGPDGLSEFARIHGLEYIRQASAGVSVARNAGASRARGDWLAFLDDDDEWHPEWLSRQLAAIAASPASVVAAFTGGWHMDARGRPFGDVLPGSNADRRDVLAGKVPPPRLGTMLIRHDDFDRVGGFREGLARAEDDHLIYRLLERGEFVGTDEPLWGYRRHSENVTNDRFAGIRGNVACARLLIRESRDRDADLARLYDAQLTRVRRRAAGDAIGVVVDAARRGDVLSATRVAAWAIGMMPINTAGAIMSRLRRRRSARRT